MNELAVIGPRTTSRRASPALALCVALVAASAAIGEVPPAERAGAEASPGGSRAVETAEQVRHGIVELRRELWRVEEMLALTPIEVGEAVAGAEQARERVKSALFDLQARGSRPELATDRALRDELERARGELSALRARLDRRIARRAEVGPPAPLAVQREAGDLEIIATSLHGSCEKALEIGPGRIRGILRPETWFRLRIPKPMRVAFRAESLDAEVMISLHDRCQGTPMALSGAPARFSRTGAEVQGGDLWVRVTSTAPVPEAALSFESVLAAGAIAGRVTRATDGAGAAASVWVYGSTGSPMQYAWTNASGDYQASGLDPGSYFVATRDSGNLVSELFSDRPCALGPTVGCIATTGDPVIVYDSATTSGVDFQLVVGGVLSGHVRLDPEGTPAPRAFVSLYDPAGNEIDSELADTNGRYRFEGLQGEYRAKASSTDRASELFENLICLTDCAISAGTPVIVGPELNRFDVDFSLGRLGSIAGRVTDSLGAPLSFPYLWFHLVGSSQSVWGGAIGPDGTYLSPGLLPGHYVVEAHAQGHEARVWGGTTCVWNSPCGNPLCDLSSGTEVPVEMAATATGVDFSLRPFQPIAGTVTRLEDGTPLGGVVVRTSGGTNCSDGWAESDPAGQYRTARLAPVPHMVHTENDLGRLNETFDNVPCGAVTCGPTFTPVDVGLTGPTEGIDFALAIGASIRGAVHDYLGGGLTLCSPGGLIWLRDAAGLYLGQKCTAPDGSYLFDRLPAATYLVTARSDTYLDELYDNVLCEGGNCAISSGTQIPLADGEQRSGIDFVLDRFGRIQGTVLDAETGSAISGARIETWSANGSSVDRSGTGLNGAYSVLLTDPGPVFVTAAAWGWERELYSGIPCPGSLGTDCLLTGGTAIELGLNGEAVSVDFSLRRGPSIRGRVLQAPDGRPAAGSFVDVFRGYDRALIGTFLTDGQGRFTAPLSNGVSYLIASDNGRGAIDELWQDVSCPNGPAWLGLCDLALATPVQLREYEVVDGIDFVLSAWPVFKNGFENGSLAGWSGAVSQ